MMFNKPLLLLACLFPALSAWAGGFQVSLQGQKQSGMSHVGVALPLDASAVYFNPGALGFVQGMHINAGINPIFANINYQQQSTGATASKKFGVGTPLSAYFSTPIGKTGLSFGMGVYTPFGSALEYTDGWVGKYVLQSVSLRTIFYQPTISYRYKDKFGVGLGFVYGTGDFQISRAVPLYDGAGNESSAELAGKGSGIGFSLGVYAEPVNRLSVGLTYRTGAKVNIEDGDATFNVPAAVAPNFTASKFDLAVMLPSTLSVGVAYFLKDDRRDFVSLQIDQTAWKAFDELRFKFTDGTANGESELVSERNYHGNFMFRLGAQKGINDQLTVRAGAFIDQSAVPTDYLTPDVPDSPKSGFSVGASYRFSSLVSIDASLLYLDGKEVSGTNVQENFEQTYKNRAIVPGVGLHLSF